jgi:hypothetical protein
LHDQLAVCGVLGPLGGLLAPLGELLGAPGGLTSTPTAAGEQPDVAVMSTARQNADHAAIVAVFPCPPERPRAKPSDPCMCFS